MHNIEIEKQWAKGVHVTSKGIEIALTDMSFPQLQNTINKYKAMDYDVSILEKELSSRPPVEPKEE